MRASELKKTILRVAGRREFYGYEMHKKLEENKINIGIGRLYSILGEMKNEGYLEDRWAKSDSGPKRRIYKIRKKGEEARELILMESIRTVHEFYTEYLLDLPPALSVFNNISDLLTRKLPKVANVGYAADRFSGPAKKLTENLRKRFDGNFYTIQSRENGIDLEIDDVLNLNGTLEDIPVKDGYLDLLVLNGNIKSDCLDSCLNEWNRVVTLNGTIAIVTPTAVLADYKDPLGIGEFIEKREHPRLEPAESLNLEILSEEIKKYFQKVIVTKVVHITVIRASKPIK
ncbi:MAG: PadR family transcriptional regulator [Promethearchaeota archaeon]